MKTPTTIILNAKQMSAGKRGRNNDRINIWFINNKCANEITEKDFISLGDD